METPRRRWSDFFWNFIAAKPYAVIGVRTEPHKRWDYEWKRTLAKFDSVDDAIQYAEALETDMVWIEADLTEFAPDKVWDKRPYEVKRPGRFRHRIIMKTADREEAIRAARSIRPPDNAWVVVVNCITHELIAW